MADQQRSLPNRRRAPSEQAALGFTVIELMIVVTLMAVVLGLVAIDFSAQRPARDLRIAQNELVTNIRKVQSYSLFSRNVGNVKPAQYYVLKFSQSQPDRYYIQAITDVNSSPTLRAMETVFLPKRVVFSSTNPFVISRPPPLTNPSQPPACVLLAFKSPFGKAYINDGCNPVNPADPYMLTPNDDYRKIIDHINNVNNLTVSVDTNLVITFQFKNSSTSKKVLFKGVTGLVCPTVDGTTCSF